MHVTPFYAALFALLFFALSVRTIRLRRRHQVAVGDAGNAELLRAIRVHSNFAEYVPLALLLVFMLEIDGASRVLIHLLSAVLLIGRVSHAYGVRKVEEDYRFRVFGMACTFATLVGAAIFLLVRYAIRAFIGG